MRWDLPLLPLISSRSTDDDTKEETFSISKRFLSSLVSSCLVANQLTQVQQRNHPQKDPPPPSEYPTTQLLHHPRAIRKRRTAVRRRRGLAWVMRTPSLRTKGQRERSEERRDASTLELIFSSRDLLTEVRWSRSLWTFREPLKQREEDRFSALDF